MSNTAHIPDSNHLSMQPALVALPVIQPASPVWPESVVQPQQTYYLPSTNDGTSSTPRPRKPYTTTKVREMWTPEEHDRMLEGLRLYKRDWAKVTKFVGTRTPAQVRSHAQKYFDKVARDKTDEYVPRARPKRKSSTPYPRKIRDEANKSLPPTFQQSQPYQVPVVHPSSSFDMPVYTQHVQSVQHTVPIAPGQSPILSHVPPSYVQPQQMSPHIVQRVYSPYMDNHHRQTIHATPEIQASPVSYVSGQTYAHSPSIPQHPITVPTPMYGVLSPITPGSYFTSSRTPSVTHTPLTMYGQQGMMPPNMPMQTPRHSHPEGPLDNCAKCAALQRYGAVLQEIGELSAGPRPPDQHPHHGRPPQVISPILGNGNTNAPRRRDVSRDHHITRDIRDPSSSGSISLGKNRAHEPSPPRSDEGVAPFSQTAPAGNRAHRAKIMKARKMKGGSTVKDVSHRRQSAYEEHSESANSMLESRHRRSEQKRTASAQEPSSRVVDATSKKRKISVDTSHGADKGATAKKHRSSVQSKEDGKRASGISRREDTERKGKVASAGEPRKPSQKTASNDERPSPKSDESETGPHSPIVDTYSPKERMELFDAVHSLQILAKTSSSGSPSPTSREDPRRSQDEIGEQ